MHHELLDRGLLRVALDDVESFFIGLFSHRPRSSTAGERNEETSIYAEGRWQKSEERRFKDQRRRGDRDVATSGTLIMYIVTGWRVLFGGSCNVQ